MNNLIYVPSRTEKEQIKQTLMQPPSVKLKEKKDENTCEQLQCQSSRQLSKEQLKELLSRLTKITKKQYDIQQQATYILHSNKALQQKRLQGDKVENRLLAKGKQKEKKIELMSQLLEKEKRQKWYRDIPQISQKGQSVKQKTIDRRLDELIQSRQHKKQELKVKYDPSFQPKIDSHSEFINDIENLGDVFNRMSAKEKQAEKRKASLVKNLRQQSQEQLTFKPNINQKSREIAENLPPRPLPGALFSPSLQKYETQSYSFIPSINKNTGLLLNRKDNSQDCFQRLYNHAKQLGLKAQQKIAEREKARHFHPSLNNKSLRIVDEKKIKHKNTRSQKSISSVSDKREESFQEVKIGSESQFTCTKTYSLRGSKVSKRTWIEESEGQGFKDLKANILRRMNFLR